MKTKNLPSPGIGSVVMIGAGLCAALLFTVARQGTWQAMALAYVTPLPIMISAMGFSPALGLGAAAIGTFTVAAMAALHQGALSSTNLMIGAIFAAVFAITQALPAWWLGLLTCLAHAEGTGRWRLPPADARPQQLVFYPIGHILVHTAVLVICLTGLALSAVIIGYGGFGAAVTGLTTKLLPLVQTLVDSRSELSGFDVQSLTQMSVKILPAVFAVWILAMFIANLWLAGRIVQTSNRLRRPWPDIARELHLPRLLALPFAAAVAISFARDWPGTLGLIAAVTLALIYALQGIAVVHALSHRWRWRMALLFLVYATLVLFVPWPLALFALLGLADTAFSLRDRKTAALSPSKP
jgi:hypothetical protein